MATRMAYYTLKVHLSTESSRAEDEMQPSNHIGTGRELYWVKVEIGSSLACVDGYATTKVRRSLVN